MYSDYFQFIQSRQIKWKKEENYTRCQFTSGKVGEYLMLEKHTAFFIRQMINTFLATRVVSCPTIPSRPFDVFAIKYNILKYFL